MATKLKTGNIAADQLESLLQRIERLEEEKKALADDIKEIYAEAKAHGYDTKIMRQIVKLRAMDAAERAEQEALLDTYKHALGMLTDTPLGEAAIEQMRDAEPARRMAKAAGQGRFSVKSTDVDEVERRQYPPEHQYTGAVTPNGGVIVDQDTGEVIEIGGEDDDEKDNGFVSSEPAAMHAGGMNDRDWQTLGDIPDFLRRC